MLFRPKRVRIIKTAKKEERMDENDLLFMDEAIKCAKEALDLGEVPVGAVIVADGKIVSRGINYRENGKNALAHAELEAIDKACRALGGWRLHMCTLYVTLEPCTMCAGAIINSRIRRVVYGASEERAGAFGSVIDINSLGLNHTCEVTSGVREEECRELMQDFFKKLRDKR